MKLLGIVLVAGSLLAGQGAMALTSCSAAQGNDSIGHPNYEAAYTPADIKTKTDTTTTTDSSTTDQ